MYLVFFFCMFAQLCAVRAASIVANTFPMCDAMEDVDSVHFAQRSSECDKYAPLLKIKGVERRTGAGMRGMCIK